MIHRYSVILGNLGNTRDRFCSGYKQNPDTIAMLRRAGTIPDVTGIELVGAWDIRADNVRAMAAALDDIGLTCVSIIPDLFTRPEYGRGAYSSTEPTVRQQAMDETRRACEIAQTLGCGMINLWPGQDGYDYLLCADYQKERALFRDAVSKLAGEFPDLRFALEYKPKEPRTHSYLARMGDTLLMALATERDNVGVCIDTGHAFVAGESVGEAIVLAKEAGDKLFHMHFNDNHGLWDDDMIVGSVHATCYPEMLYWLDRCGYDGYLSMDQYPYREDARDAIAESIAWLKGYADLVETHREKMDHVIAERDPVQASRLMREMLLSGGPMAGAASSDVSEESCT